MPRLARPFTVGALAACLLGAGLTFAGAEPPVGGGYNPAPMPGLGPVGTATMHGDAESSDVTPHPGPGRGVLAVRSQTKAAACPTILAGSDGMVVALCTKVLGKAPVVLLLDPATGTTLARLDVAKGALLGGVYAYLDDHDRLVLVDGTKALLRVAHERTDDGSWALRVAERTDVSGFVTGDGVSPDDAVVGLTPDAAGRVWLATREGRVGVLDPASGQVQGMKLPAGERVDNSISSSLKGVAVASSHALYLLTAEDGAPTIAWRTPYDRGSARKPGRLSWGTGATPSFFGPASGDEYLTITDNADGQEHLLVLRTADGSQVCAPGILTPGRSTTENSAMAHGSTVIVAGTYGYPYPALPEGAGPSVPRTAQFTVGGMERYDVAGDGSGCTRTWTNPVLSAAVPRWSLADRTIYTVERPALGLVTGPSFDAVTIDSATGRTTSRTDAAPTALQDTLEMVGTITPDGTWWQGTMTGVLRFSKE